MSLANLEDALVAKAREGGITAEMEGKFERYQKIKALVLRPAAGTAGRNEQRAAMRAALCEAIRMVV